MSLKVENQKSVLENNNMLAVLVLSNPPSPCNVENWYWKHVAGVPFLLRNILTIQQGGVKRLILFAGKNVTAVEELYRRAKDDSRVMLELECVSDPLNLVESVKRDKGVLFLDGSALNFKTEIEEARQLGLARQKQGASGPFSIDPEKLKSLAENSGDQDLLTGLRNIQLQYPYSQAEIFQEGAFKVVLADADENWQIARPEDFEAVSDRLIMANGLDNDSFMDRYFTRHISRQLTRQIVKTPITPNQLTIVSLAIGLEAAGCFLFGGYGMGILGAGLLLLSVWIDCCDGEVARIKFMESPLGKRLDIICDNLVHIAVFFAIGMGLYGSTHKSLFILLGSLAVLGSLICFILMSPKIVNSKSQNGNLKTFIDHNKDLADRLANRDFTYLLFTMALIGSLDIFIGLTALGANAFAGYLLYNKFKTAS
jgi:phosphatidylglycerophosphate synthase